MSTVGYNTSASNGGFDDLVKSTGFDLTASDASTYEDFTENYSTLAQLSGIQCESCHGPGSRHSGDPTKIGVSFGQYANCGQCHPQEAQWVNSAHNSTGIVHGAGRYQTSWVGASCARCHTSGGYKQYVESDFDVHEVTAQTTALDKGVFVGVQCAGCHDPHNAENPAQLRLHGNVTMVIDGSTVNAGKGAVCYSCHDGLYTYGEDDCDTDRNTGTPAVECETYEDVADFYFRQVHYNTQAAVLEGKGAITDVDKDGTDDFTLTQNSFHSASGFTLAGATGDTSLPSENNKCVTCHMVTPPSSAEEGYGHLGGHSFAVRSGHSIGHLLGEETGEAGEEEEANGLELITACTGCHPSVTEFNRTARADYDGDGTTEGIQDEVKGLLLAVATVLRAKDVEAANIANLNQAGASSGTRLDVDGTTIIVDSFGWVGANTAAQTASFHANAMTPQEDPNADLLRRSVWNHNLLVREASLGIHNAAFNIQVLQGTYKAITGVAVPNAVIR
jgi:hypothetical protein